MLPWVRGIMEEEQNITEEVVDKLINNRVQEKEYITIKKDRENLLMELVDNELVWTATVEVQNVEGNVVTGLVIDSDDQSLIGFEFNYT
jgi:hypothetical protein